MRAARGIVSAAAAVAFVAAVHPLRAAGGDGVVATVDGIEIKKSDVADSMLLFSRQAYVDAVRDCVQSALVEREAERLKLTLPADVLDKALSEEIEQEKSALLVQFGGKLAFSDFVRENLRMTEEAYKGELRRAIRAKLLLGRVVRFGSLGEERLSLRTIVVKDRAKAEEIRAKLADGADFIALARRESADPSAKDGGRLAPVARGALVPDIEKPVFALVPGQVSDIIEVPERGGKTYHLYRLIERQDPVDKPYAEVSATIEQGMREQPLEAYEIAQWNRKMEAVHEVKLAGPPSTGDSPSMTPARTKGGGADKE